VFVLARTGLYARSFLRQLAVTVEAAPDVIAAAGITTFSACNPATHTDHCFAGGYWLYAEWLQQLVCLLVAYLSVRQSTRKGRCCQTPCGMYVGTAYQNCPEVFR
jgi:hypothetical protein